MFWQFFNENESVSLKLILSEALEVFNGFEELLDQSLPRLRLSLSDMHCLSHFSVQISISVSAWGP